MTPPQKFIKLQHLKDRAGTPLITILGGTGNKTLNPKP